MPGVSPATDFSVALLNEFVALGVRHVVVSPGSRSQALALAAAAFERAGRLTLTVRIDERVAGFLALGIAVETRTPVLVVTTSGTAVANLHPAVLEARHSGVPLVLLTADRPTELRGIGSNQTTEQPGIFGRAVPLVRDVEPPRNPDDAAQAARTLAREAFTASAGREPPSFVAAGPVQLNLALREPLSAAVGSHDLPPVPDLEPVPMIGTAPIVGTAEAPGSPFVVMGASGTVVIAGHAAGPVAEQFARDSGSPLVAEVSSGARFGPNLVVAYRELLSSAEFGGAVRRAVVFGHPTLSREVPALLHRADVEVVSVGGPGFEPYNPGRRARIVDAVEWHGPPAERSWAGRWVHESRRVLGDGSTDAPAPVPPATLVAAPPAADGRASQADFTREQLAEFRRPVTRRMLVDALWRATWPHDRLVLGASRLIRDLDRVAPGKHVPVHANRGLAGIDGTIATATGIALASQSADASPSGGAGVTRVLIGDLTLLHDVGALLFGVGEPRPRLQVVVGNDGGGTIFDGLEVAGTSEPDAFDRVMYTPQSVDLAPLAAAYGWAHVRAANRGALDQALGATGGTTLIEVPLSR